MHVFDHWEDGIGGLSTDVANPYASSTSVLMDAAKTCVAVYVEFPGDPAFVLFEDDFEANTTVSTAAWPDATGDFDPDNPTTGTWNPVEVVDDGIQVSSYTGGNVTSVLDGSNYMISGYHQDVWGSGDQTHYGRPEAQVLESGYAKFDFWFYGHIAGTDDAIDTRVTTWNSKRSLASNHWVTILGFNWDGTIFAGTAEGPWTRTSESTSTGRPSGRA